MPKRKISHFKYDRAMDVLKSILRTCIDRNILDERSEAIVKTYYFSEKTFEQIGKDLDLTGEAVRIIFNRASIKLREHVSGLVSLHEENLELKTRLSRAEIQNGSVPIKKELLQSFTILDLDVRTRNGLKSKELKTILDVVKRDKSFYLSITNFGLGSLKKLEDSLAEKGMSLGMHVYETE